MTLHEWRGNGERLAMAYEVLHNPVLVEMLSILDNAEHPAKVGRALRDGFDASVFSGEVTAYTKCLRDLRSFAEPLPLPREEVPITWNAKIPE